MQIDFHYTVTYLLSRLAGFVHAEALTIATASQSVDEATVAETLHFADGSNYGLLASAHELFDLADNGRSCTDYDVWLPFHFLPGNGGAAAGAGTDRSLVERLVCLPDSPVADAMWSACRQTAGAANHLHRVGISCHVYADTFSHQRFVGYIDDSNVVENILHLRPAETDFLVNAEGLVADLLKLGHGGAGTDPDMPYLVWSYSNSYGQMVERDNAEIFLLACERLVYQLGRARGTGSATALAASDRAQIQIQTAIAANTSTDSAIRQQGWEQLLARGAFSIGALSATEQADLHYAASGSGSWEFAALGEEMNLASRVKLYDAARFNASDWKKFQDALWAHRAAVLDSILPAFGLPSSLAQAQANL